MPVLGILVIYNKYDLYFGAEKTSRNDHQLRPRIIVFISGNCTTSVGRPGGQEAIGHLYIYILLFISNKQKPKCYNIYLILLYYYQFDIMQFLLTNCVQFLNK